MIKNVKLKNFLINTIFSLFSMMNNLFPKKKNRVLLYSNLGFRDNVYALYQYMINNEYYKDYEIICSTNDYKKFFDENKGKFVGRIRGIIYFFSSSKVYYCFGRIPIEPSKDQITVQMWHGTSFKGFDQSTQKTNSLEKQFFSWTFASSEYFIPIVGKKFSVPIEKVFLCGHPRTDVFYCANTDEEKYKNKSYIVWLPTFRKSSIVGYADSDMVSAIPVLKNVEEMLRIDKLLDEFNINLIIKLHPVQDEDSFDKTQFKNIFIYNNKEFSEANLDLYILLKWSKALITDYSSVFYDYLLLDKPLGFTEDDFESYSGKRGFAVEDPDWFRAGEKIKNEKDLSTFINNLCSGKDDFRKRRKEVNDLSNKYQDGQNCLRTLKLTGIVLEGES